MRRRFSAPARSHRLAPFFWSIGADPRTGLPAEHRDDVDFSAIDTDFPSRRVLRSFLPTDRIASLVHQFHQMKTIEGSPCIGQSFTHPGNEARQHIHAHMTDRVRISTMRIKISGKLFKDGLDAHCSGKHHLALFDVGIQADIPVSAPRRGLIDRHGINGMKVLPIPCGIDMITQNPLQAGIPHTKLLGNHRHQHVGCDGQHQRLEQHDKTASRTRPWNRSLNTPQSAHFIRGTRACR